MRRWIIIALIVIMAWAALGGSRTRSEAQDEQPVASLQVTMGKATLTPVKGDPQDVGPDDQAAVVGVGDKVVVSGDGGAVLTFFEGAESQLSSGTTVTVTQFQTTEATNVIGLNVVAGQTMSTVQKEANAGTRFQIQTPSATISVRGTQFGIYVRADQSTQVVTLEGTVAVQGQDKTVDIPAGYGVKVEAGKVPGDVKVWGFASLIISAPAGDVTHVPVTLTNQTNGQEFYYLSSDVLTVPLGSFDVLVQTPGPFKTSVTFPPDTKPATSQDIMAALGTLVLNVVDDSGKIVANPGDLILALHQGDLAGQATVAPGDPVVVGPGTWQIEAALASQPDQKLTVTVTAVEGQTVTVTLKQSAFGQKY